MSRPRLVAFDLDDTLAPSKCAIPAPIGDLLVRLADREMVELTGPEWALRPDSEVYRRARTEAVRDARRRAEEYAAAAGSRLTGLGSVRRIMEARSGARRG